ncbi:MAG TPA: DUF3796 domain-containing protein [Firmicutes bacterium]|jgi:amino acid permease|nr:DUF3796 domain-containing protein [Candidatus Fermentithermobacillaceae bacterium]
MKISKLRFLALLGLLGLLGLLTGNHGYYGLFGFFGFSVFATIKSDEMLEKNVAKAGLHTFLVTLVGSAIAIAAVTLVQTFEIATAFIAGLFVVQIVGFVVLLNVYEKKGDLMQ